MHHALSPHVLLPDVLLDLPAVCEESGSVTCSVIYDWTGNDSLARTSVWLIGKPAACLGILLFAILVRWLTHRVIDRVVKRAEHGMVPSRLGSHDRLSDTPRTAESRRVQRAQSLGSLLKSIATSVIFGIAIVMMLDQVGLNVAPILASAGVLGLAIGFGAQSLVKDFLAGIAMMIEDQYGVGDAVNLGEATGTVEGVGLRVTRLRDVDGTVWYVRNGEILRVGNQSQNWSRSVLDVSVGYGENLSRVRAVLKDVAHQLWEEPAYQGIVIEEPEVWGVQSLSPEAIVVRVTLKTAPMQQWSVAREMRERIKARFDQEGIAMPHTHHMVWRPEQEGTPPTAPADPTD